MRLWRAGGADHAVKLLNVKEQLVSATLTGHSKKVSALTFAGEEVVVSGSADKTVRAWRKDCLLYTSPSPRDATLSRMPSSA